jgi:beta-1,4-mannosyltransferase
MTRGKGPLVVLHSAHTGKTQSNPFVAQTIRCVPPAVDAREFSWSGALLGHYDVFHLHWPEHLMRSPRRPVAGVKTVLTAALLARLAVRRTPVVWSVHNTAPHQRENPLHRTLRRRFERRATCRIVMNRHDLDGARGTRLVRHGHYRDWFAPYPPAPPRSGHLVYFGLLKEYKGVAELVTAFGGIPDRDLRLHVVGQAVAPQVERDVRAAGSGDDRVTLTCRHVPDGELARLVTGAEAVVLPYVEMGNSGAALLALSLERPIIVPRAPVNAELAAEAGPGWVVAYEPPLTPAKLAAALAEVRATPREGAPRLEARDWTTIGARLVECYRDAARR